MMLIQNNTLLFSQQRGLSQVEKLGVGTEVSPEMEMHASNVLGKNGGTINHD